MKVRAIKRRTVAAILSTAMVTVRVPVVLCAEGSLALARRIERDLKRYPRRPYQFVSEVPVAIPLHQGA